MSLTGGQLVAVAAISGTVGGLLLIALLLFLIRWQLFLQGA
jgi:hypothetical protein